ncbi:unnamed protein product [Malus baccata var. baccata]
MPLRFFRKQSCWGSGSRDSESGVSSIFEKVIMLGVWLSRFGGRCLFDFGANNLVGNVFLNVSKERCSRSCKLHVLNFGKVICGTHELLLRVGSGGLSSKIHVLSTSPEVFDRMPIISVKLSVRVTGADKAGKVGASSISEIGPRGL